LSNTRPSRPWGSTSDYIALGALIVATILGVIKIYDFIRQRLPIEHQHHPMLGSQRKLLVSQHKLLVSQRKLLVSQRKLLVSQRKLLVLY
ncbi:hypothetical protein BGX29_004130, partial [Mortierella sp. GBA35]